MGDGILTGEDDFFGLPSRRGDVVDDENKSVEYFSGILTGVEGLRGLVSPLFGVKGCGNERRGLPSGLVAGLGRGVPGVNVSELGTECRPYTCESNDSETLRDNPVQTSGIRYLLFNR
jgi:hypothetical protein